MQAPPPKPGLPSPADLIKAEAIIREQDQTTGNLALMGDKRFLFSERGDAFVMFGVSGQSWIALPIMPEIRKIAATMLQCFYGIDDDEVSLCTSEDMRGAENIALHGDHHFDQRYAPIADRIMEGIAKRSGRP